MQTDRKNETLRPLTKQEIDRRIGDLVTEIASQGRQTFREGHVDSIGEPQWISSAEFVKRMDRFLVYN